MRSKRKELALEKKVELLKESESSGKSHRRLAEQFGIGKTQVASILKRKRELLDAFEQNEPAQKKRCSYAGVYDDLNDLTWKWFCRVRSQNVPVSGPMIKEKATVFAERLSLNDFKASNGWLDRFKRRHNITFQAACGESKSVSDETVEEWKSRLPSLCEGYSAEDIFNMDETGVFFRALPDKTLAIKGADCHGGKRSKERLTLALCFSMVGELYKPLVIGKSKKPRCFRNLTQTSLPVCWRSNKKAWMTSELFLEWLKELNTKMRLQQRNILLFLDNAPCHPHGQSMSNIKTAFFPPNATSKLQPLDQGVIKNLKVHYRKQLLRHVLARLGDEREAPTTLADVNKSIDVLDACRWIHAAAKAVTQATVVNCFCHAGFPRSLCPSQGDREAEVQNPDTGIEHLLSAATTALQLADPMAANDYASWDDDAPTTEDLSSGWVDELVRETKAGRRSAMASSEDSHGSASEEEGDNDDGNCNPVLKVKTGADALQHLDDLKLFALEKDNADMLAKLQVIHDELQGKLVADRINKAKQASLRDFFTSSRP